MMTVTGILMRVQPDNYTKDGKTIVQCNAVVFPDDPNARENYNVQYGNSFYEEPGFESKLKELEGKRVHIPVRIFSFKNGGFKLNAVELARAAQATKPQAA